MRRPAGRRRDAGRGGEDLRVDAGLDRAHHGLRVAALRFRHQRRGAREVLWRRARTGDRARRRSPVLRARAQPHRRRAARGGDASAGARPLSSLARGHPQGEAASASRRSRAAVPGEIGQRRRRMEPAVRRHDGGAEVRFRGREPDARAAARQAHGPGPGETRGGGECACGDARRKPAAVRPRHQHARQGQGDLRSLAQVRRRGGFAPSRQSGRARGGRGAGRGGDRRLSAPLASLLCAEGPLVRQGASRPLGPQRPAAERAAGASIHGRPRATPCSAPIAHFRRGWPISRSDSSTSAGSTRR